jgi:predicted transcriptional regulator
MPSKRSGRKPLHDVPASTAFTVRCTPAQRLELRRVADENGQRLSTVVRQAVDEFVGDYRDRRVFRHTK